VHEDYLKRPADLEHRIAHLESPAVGLRVDEWLAWLASPGALSPRTRRPFSPRTIQRYAQSWARFFALLPCGRTCRLQDLTKGFMAHTAPVGVRAAQRRPRSTGTCARWPPSSRGANPSGGSRSHGRRCPRNASRVVGSGGCRQMRFRRSRVPSRRLMALLRAAALHRAPMGRGHGPRVGRRAAGRAADRGERSRAAPQERGEQPGCADPRAAGAAHSRAPHPLPGWSGRSRLPSAVR
jgi:hypothetical protein